MRFYLTSGFFLELIPPTPHPPTAQLSSLSTLPPADRQLREPALLSKRATVEGWLTREAITLQKYRLVSAATPRTPTHKELPPPP